LVLPSGVLLGKDKAFTKNFLCLKRFISWLSLLGHLIHTHRYITGKQTNSLQSTTTAHNTCSDNHHAMQILMKTLTGKTIHARWM
jgi:hypothetical protein